MCVGSADPTPLTPDLASLFHFPSPYSSSTIGAAPSSTFGGRCGPPVFGHQQFSYDLGPGERIRIGYSTASEWNSVRSLWYGGAYPGDIRAGACLRHSDTLDSTFQNLGTTVVAVYFGVGYDGVANSPSPEGDFVLEWSIEFAG